MPLQPHQITCLISQYMPFISGVLSTAWQEVRIYTSVMVHRHEEKVPCPLLNNQVTCWLCRADPLCRSSVLTWPSLVVKPEIDWHASMRAMESLAIPFEKPAHSDWAIHRGKQRFLKPAYANCFGWTHPRFNAREGADKETQKEERKQRKRLFLKQKTTKAFHHRIILQTRT